MVKHELFKTCEQSGFCRRNRDYADRATAKGASWTAPYNIIPDSVRLERGQLGATILKDTGKDGETVRLPLVVRFLKTGLVRVSIDEEKRQNGEIELRHGSKARKERYNEVTDWVVVGSADLDEAIKLSKTKEKGYTTVLFGPDLKYEARVRHQPFGIDFVRDGDTHIRFNDRGLMNIEHWRAKVDQPIVEGQEAPPLEGDEATYWEETFGGNTDTKPRGPESLGMDITFPGYEHVLGIPEHAGPMALKETRGGDGNYNEPYRFYNADVFEYIMDSPMTLYGSIPLMQAHRKDSTVAVLWLNAAETWIDIVKSKGSVNPLSLGVKGKTDTKTHWFSESGLLDVYVFLGPKPQDITKAYGELTGYTTLPPLFSIAYHQCRWNYVTDEDVRDVDRKFDKSKIPYDVIWLDIEYTDGKKYFTWGPLTFPDPKGMQKQLQKRDRRLVAIIDPHIKNTADYPVVDVLKAKNFAVTNKDGEIYEGWCWPGSSHWIDCFNPAANEWWTSLFKHSAFPGSTPAMHIWNDMNEPSVFNGPETTFPKDNIHHGQWEHRDVHNLNGLTFHAATYEALINREDKKSAPPLRPFVLTRAFYAGSQRFGAMWTGDNQASWPHLAASIPMVLNQGISGYPFSGADVGGFFGNPSTELLTRWYQTGIFYPFFRAHAHIDTRRREPYLIAQPHQDIITRAIRLRYALLPTWYTAFHEASVNGTPIIRPMYFTHPGDETGFTLDDQFYVGSSGLLAKPVTEEGKETVSIYFPSPAERYYDYFDYTIHAGAGRKTIAAPIDKIPLLMRAGHIFVRRDRHRRSSGLMKFDPVTLVVLLGSVSGDAEGTVYFDDGETFDYENGGYIHRRFAFDSTTGKLTSTDLGTRGKKTDAFAKTMRKVRVEKIVVVGAPDSLKGKDKVVVREEGEKQKAVKVSYSHAHAGKAAWAVVRDPGVAVGKSWTIEL
ncbi:MAG: hypothetical protein M1814_002949 [Vezdaea aestivalis]|nr:MAG: hypothetical protein M1814_002949 [Vezdaea aestivalis]